jgi:hypothetical protein
MNPPTDRRFFLWRSALLGTGAWLARVPCQTASGAEEFTLAEFEKLHKDLQPPRDELWRTIPWRMELVEACTEAAKEKKPIVMRVRSGHPLGCV